MDSIPRSLWIAAAAHYLHLHWRTVEASQLEDAARELERDPGLRALPPDEAVALWLRPVEASP